MSNIESKRRVKTVLVTGANGTIGNGVARAFVRAGYIVYGLIRNPKLVSVIAAQEIIPVVGSPDDLGFLPELWKLNKEGKFDVIVSATENIKNYIPHYTNILNLIRTISSDSPHTAPQSSSHPAAKTTAQLPTTSPPTHPHTEQTPLCPPIWARDRATYSLPLYKPITIRRHSASSYYNYGYSASYYSAYFEIAKAAREKGILELPLERKNVVLHGTHIDDCRGKSTSL